MNNPLWQLTLARIRAFYREPEALFWTFGFPILLSIALGLAFRNRPPEPVAVAIEHGPGAESHLLSLKANPELKARILDPEQARAQLRTGKVSLLLSSEIPSTLHFDPTRPESRLARVLVEDALQRAHGRKDAVQTHQRLMQEPGSRYIDFLIPGLLGLNLMGGSMWGIGYSVVEMRNRKLLKRLAATPMRRDHFLGAFLLTRGAILALELPILLGFAWLAFGIGVRGSWLLFVMASILGTLAFAGLGLLVASRAKNTQTVAGLMNLVMLPMYLLSGVFFSTEQFPELMQPWLKLLPLTALNDALRSVMIDGAHLETLAMPIGVLAIWSSLSFWMALKFFRWR